VYGGTQAPGLYVGTFTGTIVSAVGLLERLEEVMEETGWKAREWAKRANLPEATHLYTTLRRLRENPQAKLDVPTLAALADAAGVTLDWLALGKPPKRSAAGKPDPLYPSRAAAVAAAQFLGSVPEEAIAAVQSVDHLPEDPGPDYWMQRLLLAAAELRTGGIKLLPPSSER